MTVIITSLLETNPVLIDEQILTEYIEFMGEDGDEFVHELIGLYLQNTPLLLKKIANEIRSGDYGSLKIDAHTLKGSSAQLGVVGMAEICRLIGELIAARQYDEIMPQYDRLLDNFQKVETLFAERM